MKFLLLISLVGFGVCNAAVSRWNGVRDEEVIRREILHDIDDLERDIRSRRDAKDFLTYNVGMLPNIRNFTERRNAIPDVFSNLDADFVCLQEVWYMQDMKTILENTKNRFPYSYSLQHTSLFEINETSAQEAPCNDLNQFNTAMTCTLMNCFARGIRGMELLGCAAQHCGLLSMRQECISCVAFSGGDLTHIQGCASPSYSLNYLGLLVLSKHEPVNFELQFYEPGKTNFLPRAYIQFEFSDLKRVVCTHLTADLGPYFEPLPYESFKEQQGAEITKLLALLETDDDLILMGDFNTGPGVPEKGIEVEVPFNYEIFKDNNFKSPYEDDVNECTWCADNALINSNVSHEIDFIFLHGRMRGSHPQRVYDENLPGLGSPLSDHYGVRMYVWRKPLSWWEKIKQWTCRKFSWWCGKKRSLGNEQLDEEFEEEEKLSHLF